MEEKQLTLSEAIEKCEECFIRLERNDDGTFTCMGWTPLYEDDNTSNMSFNGDTALEAVIRLLTYNQSKKHEGNNDSV